MPKPNPHPRKYKYNDLYYAEKYNLGTATVFRYKKRGAPLDDPEKFVLWVKQMGLKPVALRSGGKKVGYANGATTKAARVDRFREEVRQHEKPPEQGKATPLEEKPQGGAIEGQGLRVEIARQEAECADAYIRYRGAKGHDPVAAMAFHKIWTSAQKALRELSKDAPKSEKEDDKVIQLDAVRAAWNMCLKELKTMLENMPASMALGLSGVEPEILVEVEKIAMNEVHSVITQLKEEPWNRNR